MGSSGSQPAPAPQVQVIYRDRDNTNHEAARRIAEAEQQRLQEERRALEARARLDEEVRRKAEALKTVRETLQNYRFPREAIQRFRGLGKSDDELKEIIPRLLLVGQTGAGKSSFICTLERALELPAAGTANIQTGGNEGTISLEDYFLDFKFRTTDSRGWVHCDELELIEFKNICEGHLVDGDKVHRDEKKLPAQSGEEPLENCVHVVIIVMKGDDPRLVDGTFTDYLRDSRDYLRDRELVPICLITHLDKLSDNERKSAVMAASAATGAPVDCVFFIANYTRDHNERNLDMELRALQVLDRALVKAEKFIRIHLKRLHNQSKRLAQFKRPLEGKVCRICENKAPDAVLIHGNTSHGGVCMGCAETLQVCPFCRAAVQHRARLFEQ